jgi:serine/threonine protein kinase/Flp pilus assembly protein TadD
MKTQDARWTRIRDLFSQAVDLTPEQRSRFLDDRCGDDSELRVELNALLDSDAGHSISPITGAIGTAIEATTREHRKELLGSIIGPYRLTSVIGHGGAGTVYLGERVDRQYSAQVAIKIVEGAALSAEIGRRFRAERQILANLNHPNIARLLDAGETDQGYPYLVMEYVHGEPIDAYCDKQKLSLDARIELLLKVCEAIRYAHQNLTVHRDIKPANILVLPDGTPKLLDFGIAKLLDTSAMAADLALTRMNDRVLTPEYASPEQILGNTVTTATDVYSLGVVLYELLTGLRPYKVSAANQLELERTICVTDATTPSTAVKQALRAVNDDPPPTRNIHAISEARGITPMRLRTFLEGDLDAILLRSLRKELEYRYTTIDQFVGDLQNYLNREPVNARQGNWVYYAQRFTRKHAFGVTVTAGFIVVLATALVVTFNQARTIAAERDNANREKQASDAVASFMSDVFVAADPFETQGKKEATARDLLDNATKNIGSGLTQEPAVKARLLETMGSTYVRQGQFERGALLLEEAVSIRKSQGDTNSLALASLLVKIGNAKLRLNDTSGAEPALMEALNILELSDAAETPLYADALSRLASLEKQRNNPKKSFELFEKTLALHRRIFGPTHPETATVLSSYASAKSWAGDYASAETLAREAVDSLRISKPGLYPDRITAETLLGVALLKNGNLDEAAPILENALKSQIAIFGDRSPRLIETLRSLVDLRRGQSRLDEAELYARKALDICTEAIGERKVDTAQAYEKLAIVLWQRNKLDEAERGLRIALSIYGDSLPPDNLFTAASEHFLGEVLLSQKRTEEAANQLKTAISRLKRLQSADWRIARSENTLGQALISAGKLDEGTRYLQQSFQTLSTTPGVPQETVRLARTRLESL